MTNFEEINQLRKEGRAKADEFIKNQSQQNPNKPPPQPFRDATWLFIRSYDTDTGTRSPGITDSAGGEFWLSPDIELFNGSGVNVDRLTEKENYTVEVTIRNSGDIHAYSCTVELYLCDPALGFALAAPSTVFLGLQNTEVMSGSTTTVRFPFVAASPNIGHKCMFVRVHSVVNREIPAVVSVLDPFHNRHDAQQNLVIAASGELVAFTIAMPDPQGNNLTMFMQAAKQLPRAILANQNLKSLNFIPATAAAAFESRFLVLPVLDKKGLAFSPNALIKKTTKVIDKQLKKNGLEGITDVMLVRGQSGWNFPMTGSGVQRAFFMIPTMGLKAGEAAAFQVFTRNKKQQTTGGITVIIKG